MYRLRADCGWDSLVIDAEWDILASSVMTESPLWPFRYPQLPRQSWECEPSYGQLGIYNHLLGEGFNARQVGRLKGEMVCLMSPLLQ